MPPQLCGSRFEIPQKVKEQARLGILMRKNGYDGGTQTGWDRAEQLSRCKYISLETARVMKAWFARHIYTSYPGYQKWVKKGKPTSPPDTRKVAVSYRGAVAYLIWGGPEAKRWVDSLPL